jgi:hypothetical protein
MSDEFKNDVEKIVKEIKKEVYIKDEVLQKIVALFLSIKKGLFPGNKPPRGLYFMVLQEPERPNYESFSKKLRTLRTNNN